jgi:uncharacterized protein YndB with AHSA1/START domain
MADPSPAPPGGFRISHLYDAPAQAVFAAWTDPEQVARWWRPEGLEIPPDSVVIEPRVGGRFELTMVDPAGESYDLRATYVEFVESELIVFRTEPIPEAGINEPTLTRVTFEAEGDACRMTVADGPYSDEVRGDAESGWRSLVRNLERLLEAAGGRI